MRVAIAAMKLTIISLFAALLYLPAVPEFPASRDGQFRSGSAFADGCLPVC